MDLLFISPRWEKFKHWPFHMSLLGPLTVAGLTPAPHAVTYIDENVQPIDFDLRPDAVIISAMSVQAQRGYEIAQKFKAAGIAVIMGGLHATLLPDEVASFVSCVAVGEAELIWPQILADLDRGELRPLYKTDQKADISCGNSCFPRRDLLRLTGYTKTMSGQRVIDTIQSGRGCARECPDCNIPLVSGRRFRPRKIEDVLAEIETIEAKFLFFVDDSITDCREYFLQLFTAMKGMGKSWMSVGALHLVHDPQLLQAMVDSGCRVLYIGFDRLDPSWRPRHGAQARHDLYRLDIKKYDINFKQDFLKQPDPYHEAIKRLKEAGISLIGTFAFGFDIDDEHVFEKSLDFALASQLNLADFSIVVPYPRSPLALKLENENRIITSDWSKYNGMHVVFRPLQMDPEKLMSGTEWVWQQWNKNRPIFRNMIRVFGEPAENVP
ncbi:B12-binding domain-containing radical SAM protein [candidate division CSSED10-310 bacterium]|uniref:B12-binding domain-containing radical SAM protein n=1 Tax=candidate division CSSED10-310 bacterium TaxID=2855610 RepID=A0ABV6Z621_UNCC1